MARKKWNFGYQLLLSRKITLVNMVRYTNIFHPMQIAKDYLRIYLIVLQFKITDHLPDSGCSSLRIEK